MFVDIEFPSNGRSIVWYPGRTAQVLGPLDRALDAGLFRSVEEAAHFP